MALTSSNVLRYPAIADQITNSNRQSVLCSIPGSPKSSFCSSNCVSSLRRSRSEFNKEAKPSLSLDSRWGICRRPISYATCLRLLVQCHLARNPQTKSREDVKHAGECSDINGEGVGEKEVQKSSGEQELDSTTKGLAEAYKYAHNDAKFVNERARKDMVLLSRGLRILDARARQDVAILGLEFLKLDARAREDTEKIDNNVKRKAERLHHIATIIKDKAKSRLKTAADQHWSDGALEADLRRADQRAKRRAMEDTLMALEFVKNIHDIMVNKIPLRRNNGSFNQNIMLEKNGKALDFFPGEVSNDRITAIQDAYWSMAFALSEADGIDYTDPEELELLITTLIDLDAMDGKSSVSLLAECSSSPDVNTRQALANALAAAPSMWTLGNAGMGALQRLAEDSDPVVARAASRAIYELKQQWEIEEGDSWSFTLNRNGVEEENEAS